MSVINRIYDNTKIRIKRDGDEVWFKAKSVAEVLGYVNTRDAILKHTESEDRTKLGDLKGEPNRDPLMNVQLNTSYINVSILVNHEF